MNIAFPDLTLDRSLMKWEEYLLTPTAVENRSGRWYKREDYFAPLGYGGINGSKLRQLIYLVSRYAEREAARGIITGASVLSPQISMGALVAKHYGLSIEVVLGATKPESAIKHENVAIANAVGAKFIYTPVAFNPAIQREVAKRHESPAYEGWFRLCYGITTDELAGPSEIEAFHAVGAPQVNNIPEGVKTLIVPAGSCNSATSVLYGLSKSAPSTLERVILIGIGPTRIEWIHNRLAQIARATGTDPREAFRWRYHHHEYLEDKHRNNHGSILVEHYDLHSTKFASYTDKMPYTIDGIDLHYTYEGKVLNYLQRHPQIAPGWWDGDDSTMVWIVGSRPTLAAMRPALAKELEAVNS